MTIRFQGTEILLLRSPAEFGDAKLGPEGFSKKSVYAWVEIPWTALAHMIDERDYWPSWNEEEDQPGY
jgi:hypothetical protein